MAQGMGRLFRRDCLIMTKKHGSPAKRNKPRVKRIANVFAGLNVIGQRIEQDMALERVAAMQVNPLHEDDQQTLGIAYHGALGRLLNGIGSEDDWNTLVCSLNIAMVLCEQGFGEEYMPEVVAALEGAFRTKLRAEKMGKWGFDGPAMLAIKRAFELHDEQIKIVTQAELATALVEVTRRVDAGDVYRDANVQPAIAKAA
jgi:hypothetical protein